MSDDLSLLDDLLEEGDRVEIWVEDGGVIISRNGKMLAIEESVRAAVREAYAMTARGKELNPLE